MSSDSFTLSDILAVAKVHPFYAADVKYPPDAGAIQAARAQKDPGHKLTDYRLRLIDDTSPQNTYRRSAYMTITGGGSSSLPMQFAVDVYENRRQRYEVGKFIQLCGVGGPDDWVLSTHASGGFYRSLDLMTELFENAGASVLSAGNSMTPRAVTAALIQYHVNAITGDSSQIIQVVHHIATLPAPQRKDIHLNKIVYTSEPLTAPQRALIRATLGAAVRICSIMGSAEAGPWAVGNPDLTGSEDPTGKTMDFIFDTRHMLIEIFSESSVDETTGSVVTDPQSLAPGEPGLIVQTSLQRLRNPLVRYITGDIGSLHALPDNPRCAAIPASEREHLRVIRMHGRDRRFSFKWYGVYFEFETMRALMLDEACGVLQWQVVLRPSAESQAIATLEVRLLRCPQREEILSDEMFLQRLREFFVILPENEHLFSVKFLEDLRGFERSTTGNKIANFLDRTQ
ncbi:hypothetical protein BDW71DRAFT_214224 [Aspergillus fruticulosus]